MTIKIEILVGTATKKSGTSSKSGKPYEIVEQEGWAHVCDQQGNPAPYPSRITVQLDNGQPPYPPGVYTLHDSSYGVGDFSSLQLRRLRLVPLTAPAASK